MRRISRRGFVVGSAILAASLGRRARGAEKVDLVDVTGKDPKAMVRAALKELGGIGKFVKKGDYVVLKPNVCIGNPPEWGCTTHPDTVVAMAELCLEAKAKQVLVVDYPLARPDRCLERSGIGPALAALPAVKVKMLSEQGEFQKVDVKGGVALKSVELAKDVLSADVLINLPQAKSHFVAGVSFGLKGAMGIIWDRKAFHDLDISQTIADLGLVVKSQLTLLDATRALLTNGPAGPGDVEAVGHIVAGTNVVSVDAYGLTLARFNQKQMTPMDAPHIALAAKAGLGEIDLSKLKVKKVAV